MEKEIVQNKIEKDGSEQFDQNETLFQSDFTNLLELISHFLTAMGVVKSTLGEIKSITKNSNSQWVQENKKLEDYEKKIIEYVEQSQLIQQKNNENSNQLEKMIDKRQLIKQKVKSLIELSLDRSSVFNKFKQEQINQNNPIKQQEYYGALAFNSNRQILAVGCNRQIKIFDFIQGTLKSIQTIANYLFGYKRKIQSHSFEILCSIQKKNDDLLITGSRDKTIKFWFKSNQDSDWSYFQTICQCYQFE